MTIRTKIIQEIINKMDKIPENRLKDILDYIKKVEKLKDQKEAILSYAGKWNDLDEEVFLNLTQNLHANRNLDIRPIN